MVASGIRVRRWVIFVTLGLALSMVLTAIAVDASGHAPRNSPGTKEDSPRTMVAAEPGVGRPEATPLPPPTKSGSLGPLGSNLANPEWQYASQPAPMGLADYGVNGTSISSPYTTQWVEGTATLTGMAQSLTNLGAQCSVSASYWSLQLNAVMKFESSGSTFWYWVQDVAIFDVSGTGQVTITYADNIWNMSSPTLSMYSSSVIGGGGVVGSPPRNPYVDCATSGLDGNGYSFAAPTSSVPVPVTLDMYAFPSSGAGEPYVTFCYISVKDGTNIAYDTVYFPFAQSAQGIWFDVNDVGVYTDPSTGYAYPNPAYYYDDIGFVFGGPGSGSSERSQISTAMSLEYQTFAGADRLAQNTWSFDSNTAETLSDVLVYPQSNPDGVQLGYSSSSALGRVYSSDTLQLESNSQSGCSDWTAQIKGSNLLSPQYVDFTASGYVGDVAAPDGTYSWSMVSLPSGCSASPSSGQVTLNGKEAIVSVTVSGGSGGGGGGCVASGTPVLTPFGYVQIQYLKPGSKVEEYNFSSARMMTGTLRWANTTNVTLLVDVNKGLLELTPTDQPIYVKNSTFQGWLRDPRNLTTQDQLLDPLNMTWISVASVTYLNHSAVVYDVITSAKNNFVANGVLLDMKT
jgi:hypothetical protein